MRDGAPGNGTDQAARELTCTKNASLLLGSARRRRTPSEWLGKKRVGAEGTSDQRCMSIIDSSVVQKESVRKGNVLLTNDAAPSKSQVTHTSHSPVSPGLGKGFLECGSRNLKKAPEKARAPAS